MAAFFVPTRFTWRFGGQLVSPDACWGARITEQQHRSLAPHSGEWGSLSQETQLSE